MKSMLAKLYLRRWLCALTSALLLAFAARDWYVAAQAGPSNLDFEAGTPGQLPTGWTLAPAAQQAGYAARLSDERPRGGKYCAVIARESVTPTRAPGNMFQNLDATPYRGKRVRFRAAVRTELTGFIAQAQLLVRVDRPPQSNGQPVLGFYDNMNERPINGRDWADYEIIGDVEADAQTIRLGLLITGTGKAWFDDATFEILGPADKRVEEAPRPFTARGLENVSAFVRLLGYVRHFHPSDEAARTYWDKFAVEGIRVVEGARDAAELARQLEALFQPIAPSVRVFTSAQNAKPAAPPTAENLKLVAWHHIGIGIPGNPIYRSQRVRKVPAEAQADSQFPNSATPFQAELGGGVTCQVPLAVYADAQGTLPRATLPHAAKTSSMPQPTQVAYTANDRAVRLASVALAWNIFQHFYPYFDVVKSDWPAVLRESLRKAATDASEQAFAITLKRLVAALRDGHGAVSNASEFAASNVPGIVWEWVEGQIVVTAVKPGVTGIAPGDVVTALDGKPAQQVLAEREALISGATPQWIRHRGLRGLAAGNKGETVTLEIEPFAAPGTRKQITVKREFAFQIFNEQPRAKITELEPGIFYVNLEQASDEDFKQVLPKLEQARGIVFDMRGYPSTSPNGLFPHLSDQPLKSAQWHLPEVTRPDREQLKFVRGNEWDLRPRAPFLKAKKAFITDGRAISYAESCMGIIEHYKLGEIIGDATAGTNGNINPFQLPSGHTVSWTGMKVLKHDGSQHHGIGIRPTIPLTRTRAGVAAGRDELLERAVQAVKN
jgi:C-terminal processing protease CtpA/Prc